VKQVDHDRGPGFDHGTYLNGKRLATPERVSKGDRVQIGNTVFRAEL